MPDKTPTIMDYVHRAARRMRIQQIEQDACRRASNALKGWVDYPTHRVWLEPNKRTWAAFCILRDAEHRVEGLRDAS